MYKKYTKNEIGEFLYPKIHQYLKDNNISFNDFHGDKVGKLTGMILELNYDYLICLRLHMELEHDNNQFYYILKEAIDILDIRIQEDRLNHEELDLHHADVDPTELV
jgi:hypothetical protein